MSIKVSVIVAIHRIGINLERSLNAIKNQTLKDIEILLLDAATSDGTTEIMQSFLTDKRFRYIRLDSDSLSLARNRGISEAKGKYIAFADKNVYFSDNLIESMYLTAEKQNAHICIAPMASSDIYGKHEFTSSGLLLRHKVIDKFDTDIIWNGAVTNKLFLKSKILVRLIHLAVEENVLHRIRIDPPLRPLIYAACVEKRCFVIPSRRICRKND